MTAEKKGDSAFARLQADATYLSEAFDSISRRLQEVEKQLTSLPVKTNVTVGDDPEDISHPEFSALSFVRLNDNQWGLLLSYRDDHDKLQNIAVMKAGAAEKALAATLLPALVRKLFTETSRRRGLASAAMEALDQAELILKNGEGR